MSDVPNFSKLFFSLSPWSLSLCKFILPLFVCVYNIRAFVGILICVTVMSSLSFVIVLFLGDFLLTERTLCF